MGLLRKRAGVRADARILAMAPTARGMRRTQALNVEQRLELAVTLPDSGSFQVEHVCKVPHSTAGN